MMVDVAPAEIEALLWHVAVIDHAYGHEHSGDEATASAAQKLEAALTEEAA